MTSADVIRSRVAQFVPQRDSQSAPVSISPPFPRTDSKLLEVIIENSLNALRAGEVDARGAIVHAAVHGWYEGPSHQPHDVGQASMQGATVEAAVNIREVIEKLQEVAADLPDGLDSEVEVHICNGHDNPGLRTTSVEVDPVWLVDGETYAPKQGRAQICGHPHRDAGSGRTTPLTSQIDDLGDEWSAEQPASRNPIRVKTDDEEYVLLPWSEGTYLRLPYVAAGVPLLPGAPNAIEAGCTCSPERNNYGRGYRHADDGVEMTVEDDCPVHLRVSGPAGPDSE